MEVLLDGDFSWGDKTVMAFVGVKKEPREDGDSDVIFEEGSPWSAFEEYVRDQIGTRRGRLIFEEALKQ